MSGGWLFLVLAHLLILCTALAVLHVALSWRRSLDLVRFVTGGAAASLLAGVVTSGPMLYGQIRLWPLSGALWTLGLCLGFVAVGVVSSLAWVGAVKGLAWGVERLRRRNA